MRAGLAAPVPFWLARDARQAVEMCPALALTLTTDEPEPVPPPTPVPRGAARSTVPGGPGPQRAQLVARRAPAATRRDRMRAELAGATAWIAAIGGHPPADRG